MIAFRIFLYVTVPLLLLGSLKGGKLLSADFFEYMIYVILVGIYTGIIIAYLKKELHSLSSAFLRRCVALIFLMWGIVAVSFLFFREKICTGFDSCDFISATKLIITLLLALLPLGFILGARANKKST